MDYSGLERAYSALWAFSKKTFLEGADAAYRIDFNNTDVRLGGDGAVLEGLRGSVSIISFDPLILWRSSEL